MYWDGSRMAPVCIGVHWNGTGMNWDGFRMHWDGTVMDGCGMLYDGTRMHWECARMHWVELGCARMTLRGTGVHRNGTGMALA